jgi:hypothetical protein
MEAAQHAAQHAASQLHLPHVPGCCQSTHKYVSLALRRRHNTSSVGADLRRLCGRLLVGHRHLGLPNQSEKCRTAQPGDGPQPPRRYLGVRKCRKNPFRDYGRIARASKFAAWDGAAVQVRGAKRDGDARWRACVRSVGCTTETGSPPQAATLGTTACVSLPIYVRSCVHMWVPIAHCPPDHIAERAMWSQCCQRLQQCERTRSPPSPLPYARAHAFAWWGVVHSALMFE